MQAIKININAYDKMLQKNQQKIIHISLIISI